jgi:molecular chaperone DnaK
MAPRGVPQVEVTFDIDANGILNVFAKDKASGREQKVTITASTNLNKSEIDRLVKDAEANRSDDARRKTIVETRNVADTAAYAAEKLIKDNGGTDHAGLQEKVNALRQAMTGEDVSRMQTLIQEVQQAMQAVPQNAGEGETPAPETQAAGSGDVVDGEFKEA